MGFKQAIKATPVLGPVLGSLYLACKSRLFRSSHDYWNSRYEQGGNSGSGSYNKFARFKAEILNAFVLEHGVQAVFEFGCGDGNQLRRAQYLNYVGFDISPTALDICRRVFRRDRSKQFRAVDEYAGETADLTLSLDVIYHLVEDSAFEAHLATLFRASRRYVGIYSSNTDRQEQLQPPHVRHREFTKFVASHFPKWRLQEHVPNPWPYNGNADQTSFADFYFFEKQA